MGGIIQIERILRKGNNLVGIIIHGGRAAALIRYNYPRLTPLLIQHNGNTEVR